MTETGLPSPDIQETVGAGLPPAEQSMRAPVSLAKSTRDGGSFTNDGPMNDADAETKNKQTERLMLSTIR